MEMNSETSTSNIQIGTILRSPASATMHFVVTGVETRKGVDYFNGEFVSDTDGSVWATVTNCAISEDWMVVSESDTDDEDEDDYERRYIDDYSDDAEALASAGWGTDEDYGFYGDDY
jgi:hypothetical protein